jgi:Glycosyl hydrolase catalytic core
VRRLTLAALAAAALLLAPAGASAAPTAIGIGEQNAAIFSDPAWQKLNAPDVRYVMAWDALRVRWQRDEVDAYMRAAHQAGARVLVGFQRSRSPRKSRRKYLPSPRRFKAEFLRFRKRYPFIRTYLTWNEANHRGQPTWNRPRVVGRYYDVLRRNCPGCTVVGPAVLDTRAMPRWVRAVERSARHRIGIWAIHNYIDANRFRTSGTRSLLRATRAKIWFTETGGLVRRDNGSRIEFADSPTHAPRATRWVFRLARLSPRITRIYFYQWVPVGPRATWDSALLGPDGKPRPSYGVIERWLIDNAQP